MAPGRRSDRPGTDPRGDFTVLKQHGHELALVRAAKMTGALVALQIVVGISMAYGSLTPAAQVAHLLDRV